MEVRMPGLTTIRVYRRIAAAAWVSAAMLCTSAGPAARASDPMAVAQENALVQRHCAVCHRDATPNGGLSLEHFDGARVDASLAAMMLSKVTGLSLETLESAASNPAAAALVTRKMKGGALLAAGVPAPDEETSFAFVMRLTAQAKGATGQWRVNGAEGTAPDGAMHASLLREVPSATNPGEASMYRLDVSCNTATHEGGMRLTWAPVPAEGRLSVVVDGGAPVVRTVQGKERMGNGTDVTSGPASATLSGRGAGAGTLMIGLPVRTLTVSGLFPDHTVAFPFDTLPASARQSLSACFERSPSAR
jgi:hypothetical protein